MPTTTIQQDRPPLRFSFISPGSFAVVSGQIDCDVNSTTTIQLPRKLIKRYREHSFSIIAEPNSSQNTSRCSSPPASGRVSPFRGRGFKGSGSTESLDLNGRATKSRIPKLINSRSNSLIKSSSANNIIDTTTTTTDSDGIIYNGYNYNRSNKLLPKKSVLSPIKGTPPSKKSSTTSSKSSPGTQIPKLTHRRSQSSNKRLSPKNDFIEQYFEETNKVPKAIVVNKFKRKQDTINNYKKHDVKVAPKSRKAILRTNQGNKNENDDVTSGGNNKSTDQGQDKSDLRNSDDINIETNVNDNDNDKTNADLMQEKDDNVEKDNSEDKKQMISNGISVTTSAIVHAVTNTVANPLEIETPISNNVDSVNNDTIDKITSLPSPPNETIVENLINKDKKTYPPPIEIKVINSHIAVDDKLVQNQSAPNDNSGPPLIKSKAQSSANASTPIVSNNVTVIQVDDAIVPHVIDHQSPDSLNISTISADNMGKSQPLPGDKVAATNIKDAQHYDKNLSKYSRIWQRLNKLFRRKSKKKIPKEPQKNTKEKKLFNFSNWKKNRQKNLADELDTNVVEKDVKMDQKGCWPKLFSRKNKVTDVNKEVTQKPAVYSNHRHRIPKITRQRPFGERCRDFFRIILCLNVCRRNKSIKTSSESVTRSRSSTLSTKKTPSTTVSKEDQHSVIDISLVEHNSDMRGAIPLLPMYLAWFCLICNILLPGFGTLLSGILCIFVGKPRFKQQDNLRDRLKSFVINTIVGISQFFTIIFCFVGWGWSIWWGVIMLKLASKQKKMKLVDDDEPKEDRSLPFTSSSFTDVERGL